MNQIFHRFRFQLVAAVGLLAAGVVAASSWPSPEPRMRYGSLPFPGRFTLYKAAGPADLGVHRSGPWIDRLGEADETSGGILYTARAGFLDLAHMREYIDWGKFVHDRALECIRTGEASFEFDWSGGRFVVEVTPAARAGTDRDREARAALLAQRLVVALGTWHEAATWHGYRTYPGISEQRSAFTWDDTTSHVVASRVVGRALEAGGPDWDGAVTAVLAAELEDLGAVDAQTSLHAVELIRGVWWTGSEEQAPEPLRRDFDTGLWTGHKTPWLVAELSQSPPEPLALSAWPTAPDGTDLRMAFRVRATGPDSLMLGEAPGGRERWMDLEGDLARAVAVCREQGSPAPEAGSRRRPGKRAAGTLRG
jgi:hypothetical protein